MGVEELGLLLAAVSSLAVPPARSAAVNHMARRTCHGDVGSGHSDQWALPFFVAECGFSFENDLGSCVQFGQVKRFSRWDHDVLEDNGRA